MSGPKISLRLPLTAFLLRAGMLPNNSLKENCLATTTFYEWNKEALEVLDDNELATLTAAKIGDVIVAILSRPSGPPSWQAFIEQVLGLEGFATGVGRSLGAIVYCGVSDPLQSGEDPRWIGWTFGSGSRVLRRDAIDPRFGLITALNRIATGEGGTQSAARKRSLRHLHYQHFGAYNQRTSHRAARNTPLHGF